MLFEWIAVIAAGVGAAGLVVALNRLSGRRLPGWAMPAVAGVTMVFVTVWNEYNWFSRTEAVLPQGTVVAQSVRNEAFYRPWTYVWPYVNRFIAVDRAAMQPLDTDASIQQVPLYLYDRWSNPQTVVILVKCDTGERADPGEDNAEPVWRLVGRTDPIVSTACTGGAS